MVNKAANQLGTTPGQAESAIDAALPLLLGALGRNASQPQGAQSLHRALERDHADNNPLSVLGNVLGGQGLGDGAAILGHIFGGRQERASLGVSKASGLDMGNSGQLMAMLAPVVMSILGSQMKQRGLDSGGLGGLLGQERQRIEEDKGAGGLMNAVLDRDGDGDVDFADIAKNVGMLGSLFGKR
ncbi:MAG: DUF937 domain-containing protein [Xanthomonadales bacterium]|nr:DUF937 domain-containing protein [Xanthomonadales bacterium]